MVASWTTLRAKKKIHHFYCGTMFDPWKYILKSIPLISKYCKPNLPIQNFVFFEVRNFIAIQICIFLILVICYNAEQINSRVFDLTVFKVLKG